MAETYRQTRQRQIQTPERKALKKTPETAEFVFLEVQGEKEMRRLSGAGWEVVAFPGRGFTKVGKVYSMRILRVDLANRLNSDASD